MLLRLPAYLSVVGIAFAVAFVRPGAEGAPTTLKFANGLGFAALALLALQLLVPVPQRMRMTPFHLSLLVRLHGPLGFAALGAAVAHLAMLLFDDPDRLSLLNPYDAPGRARAASAALVALAALCAASMRRSAGRQTTRWRKLHVVLAAAALAFTVGHVVGVREYLGVDALTATLLALFTLASVVLVVFWPTKSARPKLHHRHG